ncbi:hypothetical protein ACFU99_39220 [Streptomyces sp. NPDC057654]|uniref:hypothetical protein n=1 Tax=Streptomyces sp. NPDC057654 TaxID=3346196 RepID=UPI00367DB5F6
MAMVGLFLWEDVRELTVADVPVKSLMHTVRTVKDVAFETVLNFVVQNGPGRGTRGAAAEVGGLAVPLGAEAYGRGAWCGGVRARCGGVRARRAKSPCPAEWWPEAAWTVPAVLFIFPELSASGDY